MLNKKTALKILAWSLAVLYGLFLGLWYLSGDGVSAELFLFLALFLSAAGLVLEKNWAIRTIVWASVAAGIFDLLDLLFMSRRVDAVSVLLLAVCGAVAFFYSHPRVKFAYLERVADGNWKILLVDDDKTFIKLMKTQFLQRGISIFTAESGERGVEIAQQKKPDLIVLDVILPGMKGREICTRLKEDGRTRDIPVIFLTVKNSADDIMAEREVGGVSHMTKPVSFSELYSEIRKILGA